MNDYKKEALSFIDDNADIFTEANDKIWEYAELSLKEHKSAALYIDILKNNGFDVKEKICGIDTAFSGSYGSGKPLIGILGEYDALSSISQVGGKAEREELVKNGSGHGCGHSMLGTGSLAAAFAVKEYLKKTGKSGTVIFYGCPGEEGGAGKAFMAREGLFYSLDAAFSWHPGDTNEVTTGSNNSCIQVLYKYKGLSSHAAGDPELGRSALDAVELMNIGVQFLREHMSTAARIHYAILNTGGLSPNVVQPNASVLYMVRSNKVSEALELQKRVDKIAEGAALMTETTYERIFVDGTANCVPNHTLEKVLYKNFEELGVPSYDKEEIAFAEALASTYDRKTGLPGMAARSDREIADYVKEKSGNMEKSINDFLVPLFSGDCFSPGSTDVGDVSWQTPTAQITVSCFTSNAPGHSWQNTACGNTSIGHKGLLHAGKVLAASAIDLIDDTCIIEKARTEFKTSAAAGYTCPIPPEAKPVIVSLD